MCPFLYSRGCCAYSQILSLCCCSRARHLTLHVQKMARGSWILNQALMVCGGVDLWAATFCVLLLCCPGPGAHEPAPVTETRGGLTGFRRFERQQLAPPAAIFCFYFGKEKFSPAHFPWKPKNSCGNKWAGLELRCLVWVKTADLFYPPSRGQQCSVCRDLMSFLGIPKGSG